MNDKKQNGLIGPLAKEIMDFIDFKQQSGSPYTSSGFTLKAFDRFCASAENRNLSPRELAEAWVTPDDDRPNYDDGCSVRQLGQYLTEQGHPKAFTVLSAKGNTPRLIGINPGPFDREIKEFIDQKRAADRKYVAEECCLKTFGKFCAMKENEALNPQQLADAWCRKAKDRNNEIGMIRELGIYLTMQDSRKSFVIPYANGDMPKPAFTGYKSLFSDKIVSFLKVKRATGLIYRQEEFRLKDFDRFCIGQPDLSPQQMADAFIQIQDSCGNEKRKRSRSVIKAFGRYLTDTGCLNAFAITDGNTVAGPYAEEISAYIAFKKSSGFKYDTAGYYLRMFNSFSAYKDNQLMLPQQLADKWVLQRDNEHPNTRASRIGPVRVFSKYLSSIGHPLAFIIRDDVAQKRSPKPPYLFSEDDIDIFFAACSELNPDEKDPSLHIVLPAAFLFMYCMGVRTCELKIRMEHVDLETGEVIIADAKTGDRALHMSGELTDFLRKYSLAVEEVFPNHKYLFPMSVNRSCNDFAKHFKDIWRLNAPSREPRLYDFRHHLLYRNVELCMRNGNDVNVLRPYLMRHMGHRLPESFQYYFHLSPPIRKEVSLIKMSMDWMIPDIPEVPYE